MYFSLNPLASLVVLVLLSCSSAHAETYPATVEDGTAKIVPGNSAETTAEDTSKDPVEDTVEISSASHENSSLNKSKKTSDQRVCNDQAAKIFARIQSIDDAVQKLEKQVQESQKSSMKPMHKTETADKRYDVVPLQNIKEISERLKYSNEILKRFGFAYDYRSVTLRDFKKILAELEQKKPHSQIQ